MNAALGSGGVRPRSSRVGPPLQRLPLQRAADAHLQLVERAGLRRRSRTRPRGSTRSRCRSSRARSASRPRLPGLASRIASSTVKAAHVGQLQVEQDDVGRAFDGRADAIRPGAGRDDGVAQRAAARPPSRAGRRRRRPRAGSKSCSWPNICSRDALPRTDSRGRHSAGGGSRRSSRRRARSRRRCRRAQRRTKFSERNRPRPVPPFRRLKNGSKMRFWCSGAMPHPWSRIADADRVPAGDRRPSRSSPARTPGPR